MGMPLLDPLGGLLVAAMIAKTGIDIGWVSVQELIDGSAATRDTVNRVQAVLAPLPARPASSDQVPARA